MIIRNAADSDLEAIVAMTEDRRRRYEGYQPTFWRRAADSAASTRAFFEQLMAEPGSVFLVAATDETVEGYITAKTIPAPPVYDPGGATFLIDDFCVKDPVYWRSAGMALLDHAKTTMRERGAAQVVVVCSDQDRPKADLLRSAGLSIASNWWTAPLSSKA